MKKKIKLEYGSVFTYITVESEEDIIKQVTQITRIPSKELSYIGIKDGIHIVQIIPKK